MILVYQVSNQGVFSIHYLVYKLKQVFLLFRKKKELKAVQACFCFELVHGILYVERTERSERRTIAGWDPSLGQSFPK